MNRVHEQLVALAAQQCGMFTQEQARGISPSMAGRLRLGHGPAAAGLVDGVYELDYLGLGVEQPQAHPFPRTLARWLRLDPGRSLPDRNAVPDLVAAFTTAARLHGLQPAGEVLEAIWWPSPGSRSREDGWGGEVIVHRRSGPVDWVVLDGIAVTGVQQTIGDLASVPTDITDLARVVDRVIRRRLAGHDELVQALGGGSVGRTRLLELLAVAGDPR